MWFSRPEIKEALERVEADPYFKGIKEWPNKHDLRYIPPTGAIAHQIIKQWVLNK